jgi:integrase/recombinase XerC
MVGSFIKYIQFEKRYSPKTVISYQSDLDQFSQFLLKTYDEPQPEVATFPMIRSWIVSLVEQQLDPSSVNRKIACLRSFYKYLLRQEMISKNPMVKVSVLKTQKRLPHFVKETDVVNLLDTTVPENTHVAIRDRLILEFFYGTGMRLSELIGLKDTGINFRDSTVKVLGKRNKERIIPFPESLGELISQYKTIRDKEVVKKEHGNLFVTDQGNALYPMLIQRMIKKSLKNSSVEKKSPHVLRHTYATHLLNKGAEINAVKDLLGHTSLAATQVYTHNSIEKLKKVFDQAHPKA